MLGNSSIFDGTEYTTVNNEGAAFVAKNGMLVYFRHHSKNCDWGSSYYGYTMKCGWIAVDVNGFKNPNRFGKDTFAFSVQENTIKPAGIDGDLGNLRTCNATDT